MTSTPPPPLPPGIQTTILSHLLPPSIPLPQQLLSKSLLQRHLYLPPSPDDVDAWLAPLPVQGVADELTRLAGVGWRPLSTQYASDSENTFARIRICEEGPDTDQMAKGVEVMFEWEAGGDGRGWTYLSTTITTLTGSTSSLSNLHWVSDPGAIPPALDESDHHPETNGHGQMEGEGVAAAPEGYWSGFSPPASPRTDLDGEVAEGGGGGEDDYWASYDKAFTPAGPAAQTPARQRSPPPPPLAEHSSSSSTAINSNGQRSGQGSAHQDTSAPASASDQLLRSRLEMKIASMLKRIWTNYLPGTDPEYRAITFLSLARDLQRHSYTSSHNAGDGDGNGEGVRGQLEMLYEIYEVIDCKGTDADAREGFYRLVEGSLTLGTGAGLGGFGQGNRQDSSAQLNYWES